MTNFTYEDRVAMMQVPGDEIAQIEKAKDYVVSLKQALRSEGDLLKQAEIYKAVKDAESVQRRLQLNVFELEAMLIKKAEKAATEASARCSQNRTAQASAKVKQSFNRAGGKSEAKRRSRYVETKAPSFLSNMNAVTCDPAWQGLLAAGAVAQAPIDTNRF